MMQPDQDVRTALETGNPSRNTFNSPAPKRCQSSLVVNGSVTMMATRSSGVVTWEKSTLTSSSDNLASANGYWRTMKYRSVEQCANSAEPFDSIMLNAPNADISRVN